MLSKLKRNPFIFFFVCLGVFLVFMGIRSYLEYTRYPFERHASDFLKDEHSPLVPKKEKKLNQGAF